jgi:mannose-1-phosphate guanylyltransferase
LVCEPCFDTRDILIEAAAREHAAAFSAAERVLRRYADDQGLVAMFARNSKKWSPPFVKAIDAAEEAVEDLIEQETAGS